METTLIIAKYVVYSTHSQINPEVYCSHISIQPPLIKANYVVYIIQFQMSENIG